jgi:hypothetical protein
MENNNVNNIKRTACQIFSRCCGWLVPRSAMNKGKIAERNQMTPYKIKDCCK